MNKAVKFVALPLAGLALITVAIVVFVAATFDPNQYKPQIVQAVKDQTGRTLRLDGDIRLSLFPDIGLTLGKASLSEHASNTEFATADNFQLALKLRPLLRNEVIVDAITMINLRASVVRYKDGSTNIDDLIGGFLSGPRNSQVKVEIGRISVTNATIAYTDQVAGAKYVLSKLDLNTGRLANGVPGRIELAFAAQGDKPVFNLSAKLGTEARFEFDGNNHAFHGLELTAKGLLAGIGNFEATAKGDVDMKPASHGFEISRLAAEASARQGERNLRVRMTAPSLTVTTDQVSGVTLALDGTLVQANSRLVARIDIPAIAGNAQAFRADGVMANIDARRDGAMYQVRLKSQLDGSIDTGRFDFAGLTAVANVNHPKLVKKPLAATLNGSASADFVRQKASLALAGKFDDSKFSGKAGLANFTPPSYYFDIAVDRLDADRYLPGDKADLQRPEPPLDLNAFRKLGATGSLRIASFTMSGVRASNVRLEFKADPGTDPGPVAASRRRNGTCAPTSPIVGYATCTASRPG